MSQYIPLKNRSVIAINGSDTEKFMQGLITNDIGKVTEREAIYALMLTPQGKYLFDFFIIKHDGGYLIDCAAEQIEKIIKKLSMYKLKSDVKIIDISKQYEIFAVIEGDVSNDMISYQDPRNEKMGRRVVIDIIRSSVYQEMVGRELESESYSIYNHLRISLAIPCGIDDMEPEKSFPHEFNMDNLNAIDYKKGCYVGQEVTARVHYKGTLRKTIYKIKSDKPLPQRGSEIRMDGHMAGTMLSSEGNIGLAVLNIEDVEKVGIIKDNFVII